MNPDFESRIVLALRDHGGPPELAPQLVAMAQQMNMTEFLEPWIRFHIGEEWSAVQFRIWVEKYVETSERLKRAGNA
jgi:hypothetical protein